MFNLIIDVERSGLFRKLSNHILLAFLDLIEWLLHDLFLEIWLYNIPYYQDVYQDDTQLQEKGKLF